MYAVRQFMKARAGEVWQCGDGTVFNSQQFQNIAAKSAAMPEVI
jgi:hypothetical protein